MRQISGLVLVRETGRGIPNLVVEVFDSDLSIEDIRREELPAAMMQRAVRRIGSVLTDGAGRFVFSREDLEFTGNEARPDLLLRILAPEDVVDPAEPFPTPAELYVSTRPRVDAGAEEAYVIRLPQRQLDRLGIDPTAGADDAIADVRAMVAPSLRAAQFHDGVRDALAQRRKALRDATHESRRVSKGKTATLSAIPFHLRDPKSRDQVKLIEGKAELPARLPALQKAAAEEAVAAMRARKTSPTMRLYITREQADALKLKIDGETVKGRVSAASLRESVPGFGGVTDLVRVRGLEPPSPEELERRYLSGEEQEDENHVAPAPVDTL